MSDAVQWGRSLIFVLQMYLAMAVMALGCAPLVMIRDDWAFRVVHAYCRYVRWSAAWMVGLRSEIRGTPPQRGALIAAKHQSFFDIILIVSAVPRPRFIMKKELMRTPFVGWYANKIGCVAVDRGQRGKAIRKMVEDVARGRLRPGQLIIDPQGTRVPPGHSAPYKIGAAILYAELAQPCVPAATNVGVFWPRSGILRRPGLAVVEFLPTIPAGLTQDAVLARLETEIESASHQLMHEAGFRPAEQRG